MKVVQLSLLAFLSVGCASTQKGVWVHKEGGESKQRVVANDAAVLKTSWGEIEVYPAEKHASFFEVEVVVRNTSSNSVNFEKSHIRIKNDHKEIVNPLSDQEINAKVTHAAGFGAAIAGAGYANTASVSGAMQSQVFGKMIKDGSVPADSVMTGFIYYPPEKIAKDFHFMVLKPLVNKNAELYFYEKAEAKRQPANTSKPFGY